MGWDGMGWDVGWKAGRLKGGGGGGREEVMGVGWEDDILTDVRVFVVWYSLNSPVMVVRLGWLPGLGALS